MTRSKGPYHAEIGKKTIEFLVLLGYGLQAELFLKPAFYCTHKCPSDQRKGKMYASIDGKCMDTKSRSKHCDCLIWSSRRKAKDSYAILSPGRQRAFGWATAHYFQRACKLAKIIPPLSPQNSHTGSGAINLPRTRAKQNNIGHFNVRALALKNG